MTRSLILHHIPFEYLLDCVKSTILSSILPWRFVSSASHPLFLPGAPSCAFNGFTSARKTYPHINNCFIIFIILLYSGFLLFFTDVKRLNLSSSVGFRMSTVTRLTSAVHIGLGDACAMERGRLRIDCRPFLKTLRSRPFTRDIQ